MKNKVVIFLKSIDGGTGTYALNLLRLDRLHPGADVHILCLEKPRFRKLPPETPVRFCRGRGFYQEKFGFSLRSVRAYWEDFRWLGQQLDREQPGAIISVDLYCNLLCSLQGIFARKRFLILTEHIDIFSNMASRASKPLRGWLRLLINLLYPRADKIVFVSRALRENFLRNTRVPERATEVIYNGIDLQKMPGKTVRRKRKTIITVARMVDQKDHETLIAAFRIVRESVPEARLWILSDGYKKKKLAGLIRRHPGITLFGWVPDVYSFLRRADVFVLSSKREGFGIVLVEAMSQGLPVVATDVPYGPAEVLDNGKSGFLVPMADPEAMAKSILRCLRDDRICTVLSRASIRRSRFFALEKMVEGYGRLIVSAKQTGKGK